MTQPSDDRIPVPSNGHRPVVDAGEGDAGGPAADDGRAADDGFAADDGPTRPDLRIAVSPAQAAAGFGIIAALILLFVRSRRGGSDRGRGERG